LPFLIELKRTNCGTQSFQFLSQRRMVRLKRFYTSLFPPHCIDNRFSLSGGRQTLTGKKPFRNKKTKKYDMLIDR
jgi:hypothetical protein